MGLWLQGSSSCSLPCCFYREKPFLQDSGPLSPPPCVRGLCMCSLHIRGTSESPFIIHLFVSLALIFAGPLVLSVGSKGHPEQFLPSSSSSPSLGCVTPSLQALLPGVLWELHFLDGSERGWRESRNSSCEPGRDSLLLGHSWELWLLLGQSGPLTGLWDSILDVLGIFQTQPGLQPLKVLGRAENPKPLGFSRWCCPRGAPRGSSECPD